MPIQSTIANPAIIKGNDGHAPSYNLDGVFNTWAWDDVYWGKDGLNKHVPKIDDHIIRPRTNERYLVISIDEKTLIPNIRPVYIREPGELDKDDILIGVGPGTQADTYRAYVDDSVNPYVVSVDRRLAISAVDSQFCKLFKGALLTEEGGEVISKMYDTAGNLESENVPLELMALDLKDNKAIKSVATCNTTHNLVDGEIITAVFYADAGHVVSKRQLLVEKTNFVRDIASDKKYITDISIASPFLSTNIPNTIEFPLNLTASTLNIVGQVHYSDGTITKIYPNTGKFEILGLDQYVSSTIGQEYDIVAKYVLGKDEYTYMATINNLYVTKPYKIKSIDYNFAYTFKLFAFPEWNSKHKEYRMRFWIYNLDRSISMEVTKYIDYNEQQYGVFDPKAINTLQHKEVSLRMSDVSPVFNTYKHIQQLEISLLCLPTDSTAMFTDMWHVVLEPDVNEPSFKGTCFIDDSGKIDFSMGLTNVNTWLTSTFLATKPLRTPAEEHHLLMPSHVKVIVDPLDTFYQKIEYTIPVGEYNNGVVLPTATNAEAEKYKYPTGTNVYLQFYYDDGTNANNLELGMCALALRNKQT